jgi:hypothetical protein
MPSKIHRMIRFPACATFLRPDTILAIGDSHRRRVSAIFRVLFEEHMYVGPRGFNRFGESYPLSAWPSADLTISARSTAICSDPALNFE